MGEVSNIQKESNIKKLDQPSLKLILLRMSILLDVWTSYEETCKFNLLAVICNKLRLLGSHLVNVVEADALSLTTEKLLTHSKQIAGKSIHKEVYHLTFHSMHVWKWVYKTFSLAWLWYQVNLSLFVAPCPNTGRCCLWISYSEEMIAGDGLWVVCHSFQN